MYSYHSLITLTDFMKDTNLQTETPENRQGKNRPSKPNSAPERHGENKPLIKGRDMKIQNKFCFPLEVVDTTLCNYSAAHLEAP